MPFDYGRPLCSTLIVLWASEGAQAVSHVVADRVDHASIPLSSFTPPSSSSSMSITLVLQEYVGNPQKLYEENLAAVKLLQQTLTDEILPGLIDELELSDEKQRGAESWLSDTRTYSYYVTLLHVS